MGGWGHPLRSLASPQRPLPTSQATSWPWGFGQPPPLWIVSRPPSPATQPHGQTPPQPLPRPASRAPRHSRCPCPTPTRWGPSSPSQRPRPSTTSLPGCLRAFQPQGWHPSLPLSPFHSSTRTSSRPRLQAWCLPRPPTPSPLSLGSWGSHHPPCTPSCTLAPLRTLRPRTPGLCLSPARGPLSLPTPPWPMVLPLPPDPWVHRRPLSPFEAPRLPFSRPPLPTWCLHPPLPRDRAPRLHGPLQQSRPPVCAEAPPLLTCCPPAPRASTEALSLLGVGSPCCSPRRWTRLRAGGHRPCG